MKKRIKRGVRGDFVLSENASLRSSHPRVSIVSYNYNNNKNTISLLNQLVTTEPSNHLTRACLLT